MVIRTKSIMGLPEKLLAMSLIFAGIFTVYAAFFFSEYALAAIPLAIAIVALLLLKPEIGLGSIFVGLVLFGLIITAMGIEKPIAPFGLMGIAAAFSLGMLIFLHGGSIPKKLNPIIVSALAMFILFLINVPRTTFVHHTTVKTVILITVCIVPFILFQLLSGKTEIFARSVKYALIVSILPALFLLASFALQGTMAQLRRFNALELININVVARDLGYIAIIALWAFFSAKNRLPKIALFSFVVILTFLVIVTGSRTALVSTVFGIIFYIAFFSGMSIPKKSFLIIFICGSIFLFLKLGIGAMMTRLSNLQYIDLSVAGRVAMWREAWEHKFDHILFGLGTGNFARILPAWAVGAGLRHPHNIIIEYYIEWGVIGLAVLAFLLVSPLFVWMRIKKSDEYSPQAKDLSNLFFTLFAFCAVNGLADASSADPQLFITIGVLSALYYAKKETEKSITENSRQS